MEKKDNKYNALGFVEALISIVIVGISSVVLMRIAASALIEAVQNDKIDRATQFAVEGGNIVKELYEKEGDGFPDLQYLNDISQCYIIIGGYIQPNKPQTFSFSSPGWGTFNHCVDPFVNGSTDNRKECKKGYHAWNTNKQYPFFRLACMKVEGTKEKYISVKIVVGELNYDGRVTRSGNVKDYAYQTIIPLED